MNRSWIIKMDGPGTFQTIEIDGELTLKTMQEQVGGYIEVGMRAQYTNLSEDELVALCDEDGMSKQLTPTFEIPTRGMILGNIVWVLQRGNEFIAMPNDVKIIAVEMIKGWGFQETTTT